MFGFGSIDSKISKAAEKRNSKYLIGLLGNKNKDIVLKAIDALSKIKMDDDAFNILVPQLNNQDPELRIAAATALGNIGNAHGKAHLAFRLQNEKDDTVKAAIQKAMTMLKSE